MHVHDIHYRAQYPLHQLQSAGVDKTSHQPANLPSSIRLFIRRWIRISIMHGQRSRYCTISGSWLMADGRWPMADVSIRSFVGRRHQTPCTCTCKQLYCTPYWSICTYIQYRAESWRSLSMASAVSGCGRASFSAEPAFSDSHHRSSIIDHPPSFCARKG